MKVKVAKKKTKEALSKLQPILESESARIESCINLCTKCIETTVSQIYPGTLTQDEKDTLQSFIIHGISVVLIKQNQKGEEKQ